MADKTARTIFINADPDTVMNIIADIGAYPSWIAEYKETEVLETDDKGYPLKARIVLDATMLKDTLLLSYTWSPDHRTVHWTLLSSSILKALEGGYRMTAQDSGTHVVYELMVDLIIPVIGPLKRKAERRLTDTALQDLKKRAEAE